MGPISNSVAYAVARNNGWKISPSLIHAENTLGLSTQVPAYSIFISTGPSCKYRVNGIPVEFVHSSEEYLNHMSTVPSMVVTVLKDIDNEKSIEKAISIISNRLSEEHKDILNCELQYVPENIKPYFIQIINS